MFYWLIAAIGLVLLCFIWSICYILQTHLLIKATLAYPDINVEIGSPSSIIDISQRYNYCCYTTFQRFFADKRYLDADIPKDLAKRCAGLAGTKKAGGCLALIAIIN